MKNKNTRFYGLLPPCRRCWSAAREAVLLVLGAGLLAGILVFSLGTWWGVVMGIAFWLVSVGILSRLGKADPIIRPVFIRHQKYQSYLPPSARWCGKTRSVPLTWKGR